MPALSNPPDGQPDQSTIDCLYRHGLIGDGEQAVFAALSGGVSSDIWKVRSGKRIFCVKKALPKLKVAADWFAPVERNKFEVAWCKVANTIVPGSAPKILVHDDAAMLCAMEFLDPAEHRLWKTELRDGRANPSDAAEAGRRLGKIHSGTAGDKQIATIFPPSDIFHAIRLEPYLEATAIKHPDLNDRLFSLSRRTGGVRQAMIHGDVSPKNILIGPGGPIFLDAECACIGDPAFDLAFCLNHFLLKCLWTPAARDDFLACFDAMTTSYLAQVTWEDPAETENRAASLLPGLFLARIDGKSPVEYVTDEADKDRVRDCARPLIATPPNRLADVCECWRRSLSQ